MQCRESADEAVIETLDLRKELHRTVKENEKAVKQLAQEKVKVDKLKKAKVTQQIEYGKCIFLSTGKPYVNCIDIDNTVRIYKTTYSNSRRN